MTDTNSTATTQPVTATQVHPSWLTFLDKLLGIFQAVAPAVSAAVPAVALEINAAAALAPVAEAVADEAA